MIVLVLFRNDDRGLCLDVTMKRTTRETAFSYAIDAALRFRTPHVNEVGRFAVSVDRWGTTQDGF